MLAFTSGVAMLRRLIGAAAIVVLSAGLACAQIYESLPGYGLNYDDSARFGLVPYYESTRSPEDLVRDQDSERRYRETMAKIPDKKPSNDPWRKVRAAPAAVPADRHRPE
jgi:hypothetical protein